MVNTLMSSAIHTVYNALPYRARSFLASARGYYLRSLRYGPETDRLVAAALERDTWTAAHWSTWRDERVARLLHHALSNVPFYRDHWATRRRRGDRASPEILENWPLLDKEVVRQAPRSLLADNCRPGRLQNLHTSGTSGKPLNLWRSTGTNREWYALFDARCLRWFGVDRFSRWANLSGQLVTAVTTRSPPFWVWNSAVRQLYMSSYHLAPDLIVHYLDALERHHVRYLSGYASSLHALANGVLNANLSNRARKLELCVALTNAEPVFDNQRRTFAEAFGCALRETYGMTEIAAAASECEFGHLHEWPDAGHVEILENGCPVKSGESGEIIATGLLNFDMPLIRYRVGDRATRSSAGAVCACGRRLPLIESIDGRADDVLFTRDGRQIGRLDPVFKADLHIAEAQIIQHSLDRILVKYVPAKGFSDHDTGAIADRLRERMGDVEIAFEAVKQIPRGPNGKFRAVVSKLNRNTERQVPL